MSGVIRLRLANRMRLLRFLTVAILNHVVLCIQLCRVGVCKQLCATLSVWASESLISYKEKDGLQKNIA